MMAACEPNSDSFEPIQSPVSSSATLAKAVDLFVMTKFEKSLQVCCDVIKTAKCEPEQERNNEVIEAAAALGIQALAEMDQWQHTISFIIDVYGAIHLCPARIVQVCILLHAHVEEYLPCHKLVKTWLAHPDNLSSKHCAQVIRVYGEHILLPLGQFGILEDIVNSCSSLSKEEKVSLLELPQTGRYKDAKATRNETDHVPSQLLFTSEDEEIENETAEERHYSFFDKSCKSSLPSAIQKETAPSHHEPQRLLALCKRLYSSFYGYMTTHWKEKFTLLLMAAFALWALVQTQTGDSMSNLGRLVILWQGFLQRIKWLATRPK